MKNYIYLIIIFTNLAFGQNQGERTSNLLSINVLTPSIEWEVPLGEKSTFDLKIGTAIGFTRSGNNTEVGFFPEFETQYRYYYNFQKRLAKDKRIKDNSGNYLLFLGSLRSGNSIIGEMEIDDNFAGFVGPGWGFQRVYKSGFKLNFNTGIGYGANDRGDFYFAPFIGVQLGWVIAR